MGFASHKKEASISRQLCLRGVDVTILGTAHVSQASIREVETLFLKLQPEDLAVELCQSRFHVVKDGKRWQNTDLSRAILDKKIWLLFTSLLLNTVQKKIGEKSGVQAGAEMRRAIELSDTHPNVRLHCIDREISITLRRAWQQISLWSRFRMISDLIATFFVTPEISQEEIEELKQEDALSELMRMLPSHAERMKEVILAERDNYMAMKIFDLIFAKESSECPNQTDRKMLVVVGAAHVKGIFAHLEILHQRTLEPGRGVPASGPLESPKSADAPHAIQVHPMSRMNQILADDYNLQALNHVPPKTIGQRFFFPLSGLIAIALTAWFFQPTLEWDIIKKLLVVWVLARSIPSFVGAILARAHAVTAAVTFFLAPVSYFLGIFGFRLWMAAALVHLRFNRPQVRDFEKLSDDLDLEKNSFFLALYRNKILNLILLIWLVSVGLTIGNLIFIYIFVDMFAT